MSKNIMSEYKITQLLDAYSVLRIDVNDSQEWKEKTRKARDVIYQELLKRPKKDILDTLIAEIME